MDGVLVSELLELPRWLQHVVGRDELHDALDCDAGKLAVLNVLDVPDVGPLDPSELAPPQLSLTWSSGRPRRSYPGSSPPYLSPVQEHQRLLAAAYLLAGVRLLRAPQPDRLARRVRSLRMTTRLNCSLTTASPVLETFSFALAFNSSFTSL